MNNLFNKEQQKFIIENYQNMPYKQIAKMLGDNYTAMQITGWLNNRGYKKGHKSIFTEEEKKFMKQHYLTMPYSEIARCIGFTERQVRGWINGNCQSKLRQFDKFYFNNIDNSNKAYWLGFIYADGWVIENITNRNYELGIELCDIDEQHLIDFNKEIGGVHIIKHSHNEKYIANYSKLSVTNSVVLRIYSKQIVQDLIRHNVLTNKTQKSSFPIVNDNLFFDFLRGYIDGDGCIYVNENNIKSSLVHITSANNEILLYIQSKLLVYNIQSSIYKEKDKKYRLNFNATNGLKLLDLIYYSDSIQKLDRKYQKYLLLKGSLN